MTARTLKKLSIALALAATTAGAVAPAQAHDHDRYRGGYDQRYDGYRDYDRYRGYDDRYGRNDRVIYRGDYRDNRSYRYEGCRRSDGATGTILGAIAGGLIGNSVAGRHGDRTTGTIIGGAVGAVAGRAIDKNGSNCR